MTATARSIRVSLGLLIWLAVVGGCWYALLGRGPQSLVSPQGVEALWRFAASPYAAADLEVDPGLAIGVGDPIFAALESGKMFRAGHIIRTRMAGGQFTAQAVFYAATQPIREDAFLTCHRTTGSLQWILRTMLPEPQRQRIVAELRQAFESHRAEILRLMAPVVEQALAESLAAVQQQFPRTIEAHREQLEHVGNKFQEEVLEKELLPLVRSNIWPVVRERTEPLASELGWEIWQRASLWRFGWRYAYDWSPLPNRNLMKSEWTRFLNEEAIPIMEGRTEQFIDVQLQILRDVAGDPEVRAAVQRSLGKMAADPDVQQLAWHLFEDTVLENSQLRATLERHWQSPENQAALRAASQRIEPTLMRISELLFGTPTLGVSDEFARVLRNRILLKDHRWLVLHAAPADSAPARLPGSQRYRLRVTRGADDIPSPLAGTAVGEQLP